MGTDWKAATGDRVSLTVFSGGSQGDESTVLRKMRLNALQGASLTVVGLASIDWSFNVFNIPFFFQSYDELNAVSREAHAAAEAARRVEGLRAGALGPRRLAAGVLEAAACRSVADLKRAKLYTSAGDDTMTQWYKANGFQPRAMAMTDVLTGLTTGMIDALPTTPLAAMSFQWYKQTPYMLDLGISPIVGATVISKKHVGPHLAGRPREDERDRAQGGKAAAGGRAEAGRACDAADAEPGAEDHQGHWGPNGSSWPTRSRRRCAARWCRLTSSTSP